MEIAEYKFCASCHMRNRSDAMICEHCGTSFESTSVLSPTTTEVSHNETKILPEALVEKQEQENWLAPVRGIAIYVLGQPKPIEIIQEDEFVIGRLVEPTDEKLLDLTVYDAYALGVSRRHVMFRRVGTGYDVVDLNSRNGTWVNEMALVPHRGVAVQSGAQIRMGNFRIAIAFRP